MYQLADQVGSLNLGEYITPKLMFPSHTLPGGVWHSFILGRNWGAIVGLGEIFSSIFGLLIVVRLIWYVIKVLMNCSYIHSLHGCSAKLAWSFCTEVFFTRNYQHEQRRQGSMLERSDNDPSQSPKRAVNMRDRIRRFAGCECLDSLQPSDSDEELRNSATGRASRAEMREILNTSSTTLRHQQERQAESLDTNRRLQAALAMAIAAIAPFPRGTANTPPPSYHVQGENNAPTAPENALNEGPDPESDRATVRPVIMNPTRPAYLR